MTMTTSSTAANRSSSSKSFDRLERGRNIFVVVVFLAAVIVGIGFAGTYTFTSLHGGAAIIETTLTSEYGATFKPGTGAEIRNGDTAIIEIDGEQVAVSLIGPKNVGDREPQFTISPILEK
jgi:hypothetical protein